MKSLVFLYYRIYGRNQKMYPRYDYLHVIFKLLPNESDSTPRLFQKRKSLQDQDTAAPGTSKYRADRDVQLAAYINTRSHHCSRLLGKCRQTEEVDKLPLGKLAWHARLRRPIAYEETKIQGRLTAGWEGSSLFDVPSSDASCVRRLEFGLETDPVPSTRLSPRPPMVWHHFPTRRQRKGYV